jgi:hypothetical protein
MKINILDSFILGGRDVFVIGIDGLATTIYRSTGTGGISSKGDILPFTHFNEGRGFDAVRYAPCYFFKYFLYKGKEIHHGKTFYEYPYVMDNLKEIDSQLPTKIEDSEDLYDILKQEVEKNRLSLSDVHEEIFNLATTLNKRMEDAKSGMKPYDWGEQNG